MTAVTRARVCGCGAITTAARCPDCERRRNSQPTRAAHRTASHRRIRAYVLNRDRHTCHWCGGPATECDYLIALAHGGPMTATNAVAACKTCNSRRGATVRQ